MSDEKNTPVSNAITLAAQKRYDYLGLVHNPYQTMGKKAGRKKLTAISNHRLRRIKCIRIFFPVETHI